jgi:uncharacterized protein
LIKVLSIDGGGIRGIIPAMVLAEIEKRTQKPIAENFQLIAGTSTGGILALGLTKPARQGRPQYSAADMMELYQKEGKAIFSRSCLHRLFALGFILREKYSAQGIEKVLVKYFGDTRLKEALTEVLVTAYDTENRDSWFFKSSKAKDPNHPEADFLMSDVARATSAAPTYFSPAKIEIKTAVDYCSLIDGGIFANNPGMCAYVEAIANARARNRQTRKSTFPSGKLNLCEKEEDILLLSLGTGQYTRPLPYSRIKHWGIRWAQPILDVVFDGVSDTVDYQLRQLLPPAGKGVERYYRFQVCLDKDNDQMDTTNSNQIHLYKLLAEKLIQENDRKLDQLCRQLTDRLPVQTLKAPISRVG